MRPPSNRCACGRVYALATVLATVAATEGTAAASDDGARTTRSDPSAAAPAPPGRRRPGTLPAPRKRRFLVGLEGVVFQVPALAPRVVRLDPRFVGNSVALGGAGLIGRFQPVPIVGVEVGVRSGSVVYRDQAKNKRASEDMVLASAGVLLYLAQGERARLAAGAGLGGQFHRIAYFSDEGKSVQRFGAFTLHVGLDAEFLLERVAFLLSVRSYGVVSDDRAMALRGPLFEDATDADRALPVATFQTYVAASAGVAYRF